MQDTVSRGGGAPERRARLARIGVIIGAALATGAIAACQAGPPGGTAAATTTTQPTPSPSSASTASAGPPSAAVAGPFAIEAVEYGFNAPTTVTAGQTTMTFENNGAETHAAQLARLKPGETVATFISAFDRGETAALELVDLPGGPNGISAGTSTEVHLDLRPGAYLMYCPVASSDGVAHYKKGMVAAFAVTDGDSAGTAPASDGEIVLRDMTFDLPVDTSAGPHTWTVTNEGPSTHEIQLFKLDDGKTLEDLLRALHGFSGADGLPASDAGGFAFASPGTSGAFTIELTRGTYAAVCFVYDPKAFKNHFDLGMATTFDVE